MNCGGGAALQWWRCAAVVQWGSGAVVAQRLRLQQQLYGAQITDPVLRSAQGSAQLAQTTRREANVRGFNDVFTLSGWLAIGFLCWLLLLSLRTAVLRQWRKRHPSSPAVATPAATR